MINNIIDIKRDTFNDCIIQLKRFKLNNIIHARALMKYYHLL